MKAFLKKGTENEEEPDAETIENTRKNKRQRYLEREEIERKEIEQGSRVDILAQ